MRRGSEAPHTGREGVVRPQAPSRSGRYRNVPAQRATRDASRLGRPSAREPAADRLARGGARLPGAAREAAGRLVRLALAARADARGMVREGDFVIAEPRRGLLVLEVKGGAVELRDGLWWQNAQLMKPTPREQAFRFGTLLLARLADGQCEPPAYGVATC